MFSFLSRKNVKAPVAPVTVPAKPEVRTTKAFDFCLPLGNAMVQIRWPNVNVEPGHIYAALSCNGVTTEFRKMYETFSVKPTDYYTVSRGIIHDLKQLSTVLTGCTLYADDFMIVESDNVTLSQSYDRPGIKNSIIMTFPLNEPFTTLPEGKGPLDKTRCSATSIDPQYIGIIELADCPKHIRDRYITALTHKREQLVPRVAEVIVAVTGSSIMDYVFNPYDQKTYARVKDSAHAGYDYYQEIDEHGDIRYTPIADTVDPECAQIIRVADELAQAISSLLTDGYSAFSPEMRSETARTLSNLLARGVRVNITDVSDIREYLAATRSTLNILYGSDEGIRTIVR